MTRRAALSVLLSVAGAALLVWQIRHVGLVSIQDGLSRIGAGFLVILALSLARFVLRSYAWTTLIGQPIRLASAVAATIGGDALGNLTPLSLLVSEPAKAVYLGARVPTARALAALTAENFFYSISVALYIVVGTAALLLVFPVSPAVQWLGAAALVGMAVVLATAAWLAWQKPTIASALAARVPIRKLQSLVERIRTFEADTYGSAGHEGARLGIVFICEALFHVLSFAEAWVTLRLLTGSSLPVEALALDTFSRVSNILFKVVPFQAGINQFGSEQVGLAVGLATGMGTTFSLVRMGRVLVWAAIGLVIMLRRL